MNQAILTSSPAMYDYQARFGYDGRPQSTFGWGPNMPGQPGQPQYGAYPQPGPTPGPYGQNPTPAPVQDYVQVSSS